MTIPDPTAEIKAIRHRLGAEFDYDLERIFADIQRRQEKSGHNYVSLPPRKISEKKITHPSGEATASPTDSQNTAP